LTPQSEAQLCRKTIKETTKSTCGVNEGAVSDDADINALSGGTIQAGWEKRIVQRFRTRASSTMADEVSHCSAIKVLG